jgi:hypothetical protein
MAERFRLSRGVAKSRGNVVGTSGGEGGIRPPQDCLEPASTQRQAPTVREYLLGVDLGESLSTSRTSRR